MKKLICCIVTLLLLMASTIDTAAAAEMKTGFYNIGTADGVTITLEDSQGTVAGSMETIDGVLCILYNGSDRLEVTYSKATAGCVYDVFLVEGSSLDVLKSDASKVYYVDQKNATEASVTFEVLPKLPTRTMEMTLFITSDDGKATVSVPLSYYVGGEAAHELTKTEAVAPTCETPGNSEYWTCSICGKFFSDAEGSTEIEADSWIIPATGHSVIKMDAVPPTCSDAGNIEHWICTTCNDHFSDSAGENPIEESVWMIPAIGHNSLVHYSEVPADCEKDGIKEYWSCNDCNKLFSDLSCENEISEPEVIPAKGHAWTSVRYIWEADNSKVTAMIACNNNHSHDITETVEAALATVTPPTCTEPGIGVYVALFKNSAFTTQTKNVEIPPTGHAYTEPVWTWADDFSIATATFTCEHDKNHVYEIHASLKDGKISTDDSIAAKKYEDVKKPYTATVTGPDGNVYENTATEIIKATHNVHKEKKSTEGKSITVDVQTDNLKAKVKGDVSITTPAIIASYDKNGRFLGLDVIIKETEVVEPAKDAEAIKILWVDSEGYKPQSEAEEIVKE